MSKLPSRRFFLARSLLLLVGPGEAEPLITDFGPDGFLVECRGLHCAVEPETDGSWQLTFAVYRTTKTWSGKLVQRMIPSPKLREKMLEMGIRAEYDGHPTYPSLVAKSEKPVDPGELLRQMRTVLATVD